MRRWRNVSILFKIATIVTVAALGMAYLAAVLVGDRVAEVRGATQTETLAALSVRAGDLLHETQRERGRTSLFMSSKENTEYGGVLTRQRQVADAQVAEFVSFLKDHSSQLPSDVTAAADHVRAALDRLAAIRTDADGSRVAVTAVIDEYTELNRQILNMIAVVATKGPDPVVTQGLQAYLSFITSKENAGIERAQLTNVFTTRTFGPGQYERVESLISAQADWLNVFDQNASADVRARWNQAKGVPAFDQVSALEKQALTLAFGGVTEVDPAVWFDTMTAKIDAMKAVEDYQAAAISRFATSSKNAALRDALLTTTVTVLLLTLTVALAMAVGLGVVRPVRRLTVAATRLGQGDLTQRVRDTGRDEFGTMAATFNDMATQLQHTAENQARIQNMISAERDFASSVLDVAGRLVLVMVIDRHGLIVRFNRACEVTTGYRLAEVRGKRVRDLFPMPDHAADPFAIETPASSPESPSAGELAFAESAHRFVSTWRTRDGVNRTIAWSKMTEVDEHGEVAYVTAAGIEVENLAERRTVEKQLERSDLHDQLTELPNPTLLMDRTTDALQTSHRCGVTALLFIDLDGFETVNANLGRSGGDEVLAEVARRLEGGVQPTDTVARIAGDEFAVLLQDVADKESLHAVTHRLVRILNAPMAIHGGEIIVTASIGMAMAESNQSTSEILLHDAEAAMRSVKVHGKNASELYDETMRKRDDVQAGVEAIVRQGLYDERLVLHYQPIYNLATGALAGVESLVRLNHPERGLLAPGEFIGVAEETGLIVPIGTWVLQEACRQLADWKARGLVPPNMYTSVNLSARQTTRPELGETIASALREAHLPPNALALELTETVLIEANAGTLDRLHEIRTSGVSLGIDDFGTGYSSLTYLKQLPVNFIKVDRSFVANLTHDPSDREIVNAVIRLGRSLGLATIAEGVEEEDQLDLLYALGCEYAQGYLMGRPLPGLPRRQRWPGSGC